MKMIFSALFVFAQLASASASTFITVSDGTVFDGGGANTGDYLTIAPGSGEQGDLQFTSSDFALYGTVMLELNSYGVPPLSGNPVLVYGYDHASGTLSQSDFNTGTYIGAWTFPSDLFPGQEQFFDVTAFVQSVEGSYFGFDLRSESGTDLFSSSSKNYGTPPELIATVPEPLASNLMALAMAVSALAVKIRLGHRAA